MKEDLEDLIARVDTLVFGADPAQALEPFDRAVALYDADPDPDQRDSLLMTWACLLLQFDEYAGLPLNRTLELLDELERRHREAGHSSRIVDYCLWTIARHLGDRDTAESAYQAWVAAPRDEFAWCEGCEQIARTTQLIETGRPAEAVLSADADPVEGCARQTTAVSAALLPAYLAIGEPALAVEEHLWSYRQIRDDPDELFLQAQHIRFCALTGHQARARALVNRHRAGVEADVSEYDRLWFYAAAALAFGGGEFADLAAAAAARFDRRNRNSHHSDLVARAIAEQPWPERLILLGDAGDDCSGPPAGWPEAKAQIEAAHRLHLAGRNLEAVEIGEQVLAALTDAEISEQVEPASLTVLRDVLFAGYIDLDEPEEALSQAELLLANPPADAGPEWYGMVLQQKGELLEGLNRDGEALEILVAAAAQYGRARQVHHQVAALRLAARSARYVADLDRAEELATEAAALVDNLPADDERSSMSDAVVQWEFALVRDMQGRLPEAIEFATVSAQLYESVGHVEGAETAREYVAEQLARFRPGR